MGDHLYEPKTIKFPRFNPGAHHFVIVIVIVNVFILLIKIH
jgi:hypothetical protein